MSVPFYKKKKYELAFIEAIDGTRLHEGKWKVHKVHNPYVKDKWFADPFILSYDDNIIEVLVEEMDYGLNKGRIAKLTIDRITYTIQSLDILLDIPTHLSFPAIMRIGNDIYVYPENSASGSLFMYKYNKKKGILDKVKEIIGEPLTDTIIVDQLNDRYIVSTKIPDPNGNTLQIYKSSNERFIPFQSYKFDDNCARSAGDWYYEDGSLIRPAQDCNGYYGIGLVFQKVTIRDNRFHFEVINRLRHPKGYDGMHTFNKYGDLCIVDFRKPVYPFIYKIAKTIYNLIH